MFLNPYPTFSVSRRRAAVCRIPAHPCPSYTSLAFAPLFFLSIYHQIAFETWSKNDVSFGSSEAKSRKIVPPARRLQRGPSGAPPAGLPHQPEGGRGRGFATTTSAVVGSSVLIQYVLAKATRVHP